MSGTDGEDSESQADEAPREDDSERVLRRGFFTEGFRHLLKPIADLVEKRLERVGIPTHDDYADADPGGPPAELQGIEVGDGPFLRPPGALPEEEFLDRCLSSGQCVRVCPVAAIKLARSDNPRHDDKPFIDPDAQACVVCEDLPCMTACPSGALVPVARDDIEMGLAVLREELCLRSQGEDCQICVDKCPIGSRAIEIPETDGAVEVYADGCTGCGVCQMYCPTEPRAIVIEPPRAIAGSDPGESAVDSGSYFPVGEDEDPDGD